MVSITDTVVIERPVEEVWKFLSDPANNPRWYSDQLRRMILKGGAGTLEVRVSPPGPVEVGTTFEVHVQALGRARPIRARCTTFVENRTSTWEFLSGFTQGSTDSWRMESIGERSTSLTRVYELKVGGLWRLIRPMIVRGTRRSHQVEMGNLKRILEGEPHPPGDFGSPKSEN